MIKIYEDLASMDPEEMDEERRLAYVRPKVEKNDNGKNIITYEGVDSNKKWSRLETYGPKLVENITQGIARDLLMYSMRTITSTPPSRSRA